ncbi:unnamed protein product [Didymodactylos carnosus]|uniref:Nuclear receptor coactivator 6 TRADD-N domain-containing protein n=1 Tax=Didymodactylos carnosus TaxID=1234261 RepID=A0A8S2Y3J6_9BILA|nr:unnamed protein product [Didymodactylos carnosus]
MPPNHEIVEISLTCEGNFLDPTLKQKLYDIKDKLQHILHTGRHQHFELKKIEPWNSVKVTFDIPKEAADRLKLLAIQGNKRLKELGILSVEIGHSSAISLKQNDNTTNTNSKLFGYLAKQLPTMLVLKTNYLIQRSQDA